MERAKTIIVAIWSIIMSALGILAIPVMLLITCNVIDYITGLIASKFRNQEIDSYKGIRGIAKKICMWLLVGVGVTLPPFLQPIVSNLKSQVEKKAELENIKDKNESEE